MPKKTAVSELRQDIVSGEWVAIAPGRALRPKELAKLKQVKASPKSTCPFEDPQKTGHGNPLLALDRNGKELSLTASSSKLKVKVDWFLQVVPNKFPVVGKGDCSTKYSEGPYAWMEGVGFHEVVIYRDHERDPANFKKEELEAMLLGYKKRYLVLSKEKCVEYILIYHNHGREAGASIFHPHSQIIALPVIPPDVSRSIKGSSRYFEEYSRCVHCDMVAWEKKSKKRLVFENSEMIAFCPFASKVPFEVRIFPKKHENSFEAIDERQIKDLADALKDVLGKIKKGLGGPSYNFFIHTAPRRREEFTHYHWHIEILPRTSIWAGVELGTGIEVSSVAPEDAATYLRKS